MSGSAFRVRIFIEAFLASGPFGLGMGSWSLGFVLLNEITCVNCQFLL
jgi:hypothetical protein